jgi:hypothetical protein
MSIFNTILEKLGLQKPAAPAAKPTTGVPAASSPTAAPSTPGFSGTGYTPPGPAAISVVDVMSKLETLGKKAPELDWKVSIVDMLKLLGIDSSLNARKELATELGCPSDLIGGDYAKMNVWLHQAVLQKIADNGGNIPQSLLHK